MSEGIAGRRQMKSGAEFPLSTEGQGMDRLGAAWRATGLPADEKLALLYVAGNGVGGLAEFVGCSDAEAHRLVGALVRKGYLR